MIEGYFILVILTTVLRFDDVSLAKFGTSFSVSNPDKSKTSGLGYFSISRLGFGSK